MSDRISLNVDDLQVTSFAIVDGQQEYLIAQPADSWPAVCTCIGICEPSADVYCSGGCAPYPMVAAE